MQVQNQVTVLHSVFASHAARLTAKGATPGDIKAILGFASEQVCAFVAPCIDADVVKGMHNQKALKRLSQACAFITSGDSRAFDKATALIVSAIALAKDKIINFQNMRFAMGGAGGEDTAHIKGVSRSKLSKFLGAITNEGTRVSQCSRTVGTGGFLTAFGIVRSVDKHSFEIINPNHPLLVAYAARLEKMTDGQFALLTEEK